MTSDDTAILSTYKQTELGHVPAAWDVKALRDFARIETGSTPPTADPKNYGDEHLFVSPGDMGVAKWITRTEKRLSAKGFAASRRFPQGSVLFVCIGSTIGKCGVASTELTSNQQINAVLPGCDFSSDFLYYALSAATLRVRALAGEQAVPMVNKSGFAETKVALPPVEEQRAIAEALSDTDAVIEGLDCLIAKKRDLKQAAMQQLLTGQTRLPGFRGNWEAESLGNLARIQRGASPRPIDSPQWFDENSLIGWVRISDVTASGALLRGTTQKVSALGVRHSRFVAKGSLIMSICATVGRPVITEIDVCIHDGFVVFDDLQIDKLFGFHLLKFMEPDWSKHGQTGSQMNLNTGLINKTIVGVPPFEEQVAIAAALSDMDSEIELLEARRDKASAIKQAMMQELLTGRIRLV